MSRGRAGGALVAGLLLGGTLGLVLGALLAIPAAELVRGGRPVVLGAAIVGAAVGALVAYRAFALVRPARPGQRRDDGVAFAPTFKRKGEARPPVWQRAGEPQPDRTRGPQIEEAEAIAMQQRDTSAAPTGELNALLGKGSEFEGKLAFEGKVRIDGTFTGEIATNDLLMVGDGAKVSAEIACGTIIVQGEIVGNIRATTAVELHRPARVRGDITTPSLMVEKGVIFEGRSKMESEASNVVPIHAATED